MDIRIAGRSSQNFLARLLVKICKMQFLSADVPPARQRSADEQIWHNRSSDQSLHIPGNDEILFCGRQGVRQVRERTDQEGAAPCHSADSDQSRSSPAVNVALNRY